MNLERFIVALGPGEVVDGAPGGAAPVEIHGLAYDSRSAAPGTLFFCVRGRGSDGHDFAPAAKQAGAAALVVEHPVPVDLPQLVVADSRAAMPVAANLFYGEPSAALEVAGITGTNGKTTTAFLLHSILEASGRGVGLLTNIERRVGGERRATGLNTPEAIDLQRLLREMLDRGDEACVLEATSEAQAQGRLEGTRFAVLVFTNLTQDHLNFHGTMDAYFAAKAALFAQADRAVVNVAGEWGQRLAASLPDAVTFDRTTTVLDGIDLKLRGAFNRENAIGAVLAAQALGVGQDAIRAGIEAVQGVPGRFESIDAGQPFTVIVDYAHTPDSLENVIRTARGLGDGRLTVVFGAGGDRDRGKRPEMGRVVSALSDRSILTSDNPRSEDPEAIAAEVASGATGSFEQELDRRAAIELALAEAGPGEIVVIAGRGAEPEQELAAGKVPFDDREVARETLRRVTTRP
ncbi:MAG TPA: UDP-N-acetylmuramoyl-L-alanyl-D-glutamate--2,6-diaminopimelate ligase [Gaiellaceae bacterium]|jgi:UDP-N-acetylmuramoyl-L-alanyl-D-glutamate--2,6-diaminopimelate ligase|nr:UDP-N-acetylmuramoyl-L-alanyl-D-glutamate--2,6-diaminopimelate ligase [Gaiellaceae bacterium]